VLCWPKHLERISVKNKTVFMIKVVFVTGLFFEKLNFDKSGISYPKTV
jgi:hypothetical protein